MAVKCTNWREVELEFARAKEEYDRKAVEWLSALGERVVKYAREHGSYTDHTGNLRNSIGYVVVQYGRIIAESFKYNRRVRPDGNPKGNKGADEAHAKGLEHARSVARELPANKTYLVWVAGMEYAKYVEAKGFDVLEGSGNWVESTAEKTQSGVRSILKIEKAMNLTSTEIFKLVWDRIRDSLLGKTVPMMYADHYPNNPSGEFIVVGSLSNVVGDSQVATVNVNIYVPDTTPTIGREEQRYPDRNRLNELTRLAFDSLGYYPINERWFFDVSDETLISEEGISYTFSNLKVKLKKY